MRTLASLGGHVVVMMKTTCNKTRIFAKPALDTKKNANIQPHTLYYITSSNFCKNACFMNKQCES